MNRIPALLAVLALVVAGVAVPVAGTAPAVPVVAGQVTADESAAPLAPGASLAAVVAVQGSEVEGDLADRAFGIRVARANSSDAKAAVVAERVDDVRERLDRLRERKRDLDAAYENDSLSRDRYHAELAALAARSAVADRHLGRVATVSAGLPAETLAENGVNASAIAALRTGASDLRGPEVAEIARSIAGPGIGEGLAVGPDAGRPTAPGIPTPRGDGASGQPDRPGGGNGAPDVNVTAPDDPDDDETDVNGTLVPGGGP